VRRVHEEFVSHLLGQLHQVVYIHKGSPFNPAQTELLRRVVQWIAEKSAEQSLFEYFADGIEESAQKVLVEMQAHHA
jgi:hypothetical protein